VIQFLPDNRTHQLFSAFLQDEIQLVPDRLRLTLGLRCEHNDSTGFEFQPNTRLLWTINKQQSVWAAASRAVRTPTRLEEDLQIVTPGVSFVGNRDFGAESVIAYELGYRIQPAHWLALDIATFYNNYDDLRSIEFTGTSFTSGNKLNAQTYGVEVGATMKAAEWWTIRVAYTHLNVQLQTDPGSTDTMSVAASGNDPQNQVYLRSSMNITRNVDLDCAVRYVGELSSQHVPGYVAADVRLAWRPNEHLELAVVGQNLLDSRHPEFGASTSRHELQRGGYAMLTYKW
jgi:iron complex outermembrane receptor protein